ncbi:MAG: NAD-dependent epimerase/dehydratase family protein [Planctomycetota bacterium]|nr:MAG: NAD-dependent epimerase/dehydratase family protein [Planctomycetota bacterium]
MSPSHPYYLPTPVRRAPGSILVTGGAGFIGGCVARELLAGGTRVVVADDLSSGFAARVPGECELHRVDVSDPARLTALLTGAGPFDAVLHLAARVGVRRVLAAPEACRHENLAGVRALLCALESLPAGKRPRVFAASTSEVYREKRGPLEECDAVRDERGVGRWAYAGSKLAGERALDAARHLWPDGAGPVHLRFFNVVGPGQDAESGMVLPTFVEQALAGRPLTVHGDGTQVRTLGHVDDVARALAAIVREPGFPAGALNLGGTARTTVLALAEEVSRACRARTGVRAPVATVDPRRVLSPSFEAVTYRVPSFGRARSLGVRIPARALAAIVADTIERHEDLRHPRAETCPRAGSGRSVCASPAS